jgi:D-alanyl-D-alanine carboxypeptidase
VHVRFALVAVLLLAGCAAQAPPPAGPTTATRSSAAPTTAASAPVRADPVISGIPDRQWAAMLRTGVVRPGCPAGRTDLRRVEVNFHDWQGGVQRGVLVVNRDVAADVAAIFTAIFAAEFPIRSMRPIEEFGGDDNASMAADNTSAYNCRTAAQANSGAADSPHANGRAVDINPRENPWLDPRCGCFMPTAKHAARTPGKGKILEGGPVWRAFTKRGWIWQDFPTADYQHFDTGYPSRPW